MTKRTILLAAATLLVGLVAGHALAKKDPTTVDMIKGKSPKEAAAALLDKARGYAVSLIKTGLKLVGRPAGGVRPPLLNPPQELEEKLQSIILRGQAIVEVP